jgi:hypothetical protein
MSECPRSILIDTMVKATSLYLLEADHKVEIAGNSDPSLRHLVRVREVFLSLHHDKPSPDLPHSLAATRHELGMVERDGGDYRIAQECGNQRPGCA